MLTLAPHTVKKSHAESATYTMVSNAWHRFWNEYKQRHTGDSHTKLAAHQSAFYPIKRSLTKQGCAVPLCAPYPLLSQHNLLEEEAGSPAGPWHRRENRNYCAGIVMPRLECMHPDVLFVLILSCCRRAATRIAPSLQPQARSSFLKKHDPLSGSHQKIRVLHLHLHHLLLIPSYSKFEVRSPSALLDPTPITHMQKDAHLAHPICFKE